MKNVALVYGRNVGLDVLEDCRKVARKHGWDSELYHDSGHETYRPAWHKLRLRLKHPDVAAVVVPSSASIARSLVGLLQFLNSCKKYKVQFISLAEAKLSVNSLTSEFQNLASPITHISETQKANAQFYKSQGAYWGGKAPLGLKIIGKGLERKLVVSDETYGDDLRYIDTVVAWLKLYTGIAPIGVHRGAKVLNSQGYRWRANNGKPTLITSWNLEKLNRLVGKYKGFIPDELYYTMEKRVQERSGQKENGPVLKRPPMLLWHLLYCTTCGRKFYSMVSGKNEIYRHVGGSCPDNISLKTIRYHEQVFQDLDKLLSLTPAQVEEVRHRAEEQERIRRANEEEVSQRITRLREEYIEGRLEKEVYLQEYEKLKPVNEIQTSPVILPNFPSMAEILRKAAEKKPDVVNRALRELIVKVLVKREQVVGYVPQPWAVPLFRLAGLPVVEE